MGPDSSSATPISTWGHRLGVLSASASSNLQPHITVGTGNRKDSRICKCFMQSWMRSCHQTHSCAACRHSSCLQGCLDACLGDIIPAWKQEGGRFSIPDTPQCQRLSPISADIWGAKRVSRLTPASTNLSLHHCWYLIVFAEETGMIYIYIYINW